MEKTIIFQVTEDTSLTKIHPLYWSKGGAYLMSLKIESHMPSHPIIPWPSGLSPENPEDLNNAIISRDEFKNAQGYIHFFTGDEREFQNAFTPPGFTKEFWFFIRTCPLVNRGVPATIDILKHYTGSQGYFPFQEKESLGVFFEFFERRQDDFLRIILEADELFPLENQQDYFPLLGIEVLYEEN